LLRKTNQIIRRRLLVQRKGQLRGGKRRLKKGENDLRQQKVKKLVRKLDSLMSDKIWKIGPRERERERESAR
jgi:hypothetical protein